MCRPTRASSTIRAKYDIVARPYHKAGWWRECVLGPIEAVEYRLQEKSNGPLAARCMLWDMETFSQNWGQACVGRVRPARRAGAAAARGWRKYLLANILRHLRDQPFHLFEAMAPLDNPAALGLLQGLEFQQVDSGHCFRRAVTT